jgi:hypothetical protein
VTGNSLVHLANTAKHYTDNEINKIKELIPESGPEIDTDLLTMDEEEFNQMVVDTFGSYFIDIEESE